MKSFERMNEFTKQLETFDPHQIFTSPSIRYSGREVYARTFTVTHSTASESGSSAAVAESVQLQVAFQVRQKPGSYGIGQETVGATRRGEVVDPLIGNEQLEYYTQQRVGILLHGLLVKAPSTQFEAAGVVSDNPAFSTLSLLVK